MSPFFYPEKVGGCGPRGARLRTCVAGRRRCLSGPSTSEDIKRIEVHVPRQVVQEDRRLKGRIP